MITITDSFMIFNRGLTLLKTFYKHLNDKRIIQDHDTFY